MCFLSNYSIDGDLPDVPDVNYLIAGDLPDVPDVKYWNSVGGGAAYVFIEHVPRKKRFELHPGS